MPEYFEIKVKGFLDPYWSDWFSALKLTHLEGDVTLLSVNFPIRRLCTACSNVSAIST